MQLVANKSNERLDVFLARTAPEFSRSFWQKQCSQNLILVNNTPAKANTLLKQGQHITAPAPQTPQFSDQSLPIIYEDKDVMVINKPAGLLTHAKGQINSEFTVGEFMRLHSTDSPASNRPGIVHRLDRDTSGVIITAKTAGAKHWLQKQFASRKVKKTYIALVHGQPKESMAVLDLPIGRNPKKPQAFKISPNGKPAQTTYETLNNYTHYTLVKLTPFTGRTHQLRVHMHYLGCPIVGDSLYGTPAPLLGRMFLHAAKLELTLPTRERMVFEAPLPAELQQYLDALPNE